MADETDLPLDRTPREVTSRERTTRSKAWAPSSKLPEPTPRPGVVYRWVRIATHGESDPSNASERFRDGWTPVKAEDHPELKVMGAEASSRFPGSVEIGGLILCQNSQESSEARRDYYMDLAGKQMDSVDHNYMRQSDPRMPLLRPQRESRTTYTKTNRGKK